MMSRSNIVTEQRHSQGRINRLLLMWASAVLTFFMFLTVIPQTETIVYADDVVEVSTVDQLTAAISNSSPQSPQKVKILTPITITSTFDLQNKGMEIVGGELNVYKILVQNGYLKLSAGTISGGSGEGIINFGYSGDGKFEMSGGTINCNVAHGVGVMVSAGSFEMSGGTINCNVDHGESVKVFAGRFEMSGGTIISGNSSEGVDISGGTFSMSGGSISNNSTTQYAVNKRGGTFDHTSGTITGKVSYGGILQCVVTFHANNGTDATDSQIIAPSTSTALKSHSTLGFTYADHTFKGWAESDTATSETYTDGQSVTLTANKQLYAVWEAVAPTTHTVTYVVENGKWNDETTANKTEPVADGGHLAQIPAVGNKPNGGYREGSWSSPAPDTSTSISENKLYTYTYAPITVTFNANGGTCTTASATVGENGKLTSLPTATWAGHNCTGWFDENTSQTTAITLDKVYTADTTLTAHWTEASSTDHTITVTDDGHGTGTATPSSCSNDTVVRLSATPDRDYVFDRWTSESGVRFADPNSANTTFSMIDSDVTVKANFKLETPTEKCTITFDKNGGSGTMNPQQVNKGTATKIKKSAFTRDGYSFKNWNTKSDGSGTSYAEEGNITTNTDLTLYAQWKKNEPEPTPEPTPEPSSGSDQMPEWYKWKKQKNNNEGSEEEHSSSGSSTPSGTNVVNLSLQTRINTGFVAISPYENHT